MSNTSTRYYTCFVPLCKSTTKATPQKRFITVPRIPKKRKLWWLAARRAFPMLKYDCYCCEDHFNLEEDVENYLYIRMIGGNVRMKAGIVPHKFQCQGRDKPPNENRKTLARKRKILELIEDQENRPVESPIKIAKYNGNVDGDQVHISEDSGISKPPVKHVGVQVKMPYRSTAVQVNLKPHHVDAAVNTEKIDMNRKNDWLPSPFASSSCTSDEEVVSDKSQEYEPPETDTSEEDTPCLSIMATRKHIKRNPMTYIGLPKEHLEMLSLLSAKITYRERSQHLTKTDVISLILMKIKTGICSNIIADMFDVSTSCVSKIMSRYIPVLASCLKGLIRWPPSETIQNRLPHAFKAYYHRVETIIDCFEIQIEKPSGAMLQSMSWSSYKKCNTVKYLISATPDGLINFVSSGRPGRCTDMELVRESGYLECLREGVTVLADRGFKELESELMSKGCKLVRPLSVRKNEQLCTKDVVSMKAVAALRIHIERVIRRVRLYKLLSMHACVPLNMVDLLDDVVKIACGLINIQERIVKV